jgi:SOS response regulatory protein OraA/RecX
MEKTWEIKEQELREQIAKDVIAFLQNTEWYDDAQVIEIIKGK